MYKYAAFNASVFLNQIIKSLNLIDLLCKTFVYFYKSDELADYFLMYMYYTIYIMII